GILEGEAGGQVEERSAAGQDARDDRSPAHHFTPFALAFDWGFARFFETARFGGASSFAGSSGSTSALEPTRSPSATRQPPCSNVHVSSIGPRFVSTASRTGLPSTMAAASPALT